MTFQAIDIHKSFGDTEVLKGVSLSMEAGEFIALLGPSGSGKTTLLNIIAGLVHADQGRLDFDGEDITRLPSGKRHFGFVFQNYALFRHMTVAQNVAFGLNVLPRRSRPNRTEIATRTQDLLDMIELPHLGDRFPAQLSGGQRQAVTIARAFLGRPPVLLMDEPTSAMDNRSEMHIKHQLAQLKPSETLILITHKTSMLDVVDRVIVMEKGAVIADGPKEQVLNSLKQGRVKAS